MPLFDDRRRIQDGRFLLKSMTRCLPCRLPSPILGAICLTKLNGTFGSAPIPGNSHAQAQTQKWVENDPTWAEAEFYHSRVAYSKALGFSYL